LVFTIDNSIPSASILEAYGLSGSPIPLGGGQGQSVQADDLAPGIIDFSPYWRPMEYAEAMLVVDGLLDFDEGEELICLVGTDRYQLQMLVRALIFRVVAWSERCKEFGPLDEWYQKSFERALQLVSSLILMSEIHTKLDLEVRRKGQYASDRVFRIFNGPYV
jgi:hypothetical protein